MENSSLNNIPNHHLFQREVIQDFSRASSCNSIADTSENKMLGGQLASQLRRCKLTTEHTPHVDRQASNCSLPDDHTGSQDTWMSMRQCDHIICKQLREYFRECTTAVTQCLNSCVHTTLLYICSLAKQVPRMYFRYSTSD